MRSVAPRDPMKTREQSASEEASYVEKALGLVLLLLLVLGCVYILAPFLKAISLVPGLGSAGRGAVMTGRRLAGRDVERGTGVCCRPERGEEWMLS